jgi:hypothetical protein
MNNERGWVVLVQKVSRWNSTRLEEVACHCLVAFLSIFKFKASFELIGTSELPISRRAFPRALCIWQLVLIYLSLMIDQPINRFRGI